MMEGGADGRKKLNEMRDKVGLPKLPDVKFNLDFNEDKLKQLLGDYFHIESIQKFGTYDLITRIVYPLYIKPDEPEYGSKFNKIAYNLSTMFQGYDNISRLFLYCLRKK